ncbi:MAG TPA: pyridoxal-dependent decarboxylase [Candidatus Limnocylindrales bacterium]|nr:pyridoxal-dependent decarboxylase [Candidatus Limnocylindrales bacterium]
MLGRAARASDSDGGDHLRGDLDLDRRAYRDRFAWHPEPELIGIRDAALNRGALERAGAEVWDAALHYLFDHALERATGEPIGYDEMRALYYGTQGGPSAAPRDPARLSDLLDEFGTRLAPHMLNSWHPRQFSYFTPPPLVASIAGETLAQWLNQGIDVWNCGPAGAFVEEEVIRWLSDLVGYPAEEFGRPTGSFGVLTSGGVMANFLALTVARDVHLARLLGLDRPPRGGALEGVRVYVSDQAHFSIARGLAELGFPDDTLVIVASDDRFRLTAPAVEQAIARDRSAGLVPLAIAAVAGSTNTGSVDDVPALAALARREGLWLHVDAAYGAAARLSPRLAPRVPGLELADSVTVDPHKWLFQAYDIGALVVRRREELLQTFHRSPEYYRGGDPARADPADEPLNFYRYSMEGSRRFRALKLWLSWKHLGTSGLARLVEMTFDVTAHLSRRASAMDEFEISPAEPELSVVCLRHLPFGADTTARFAPDALDAHQDRLATALEASGEGWLSTTTLHGRTWLRAGNVNYLATEADVDRLLAALRKLASGT